MRGGWVRLWRRLREHPFWLERRRFSRAEAWVDLILMASYEDHDVSQGNRILTVGRGQVLTSQVELARAWAWSRETVHAFLLRLERLHMVAIETSKATDTGYTLISLLNYEQYQGGTEEETGIDSAIGPTIQSGIHPSSTQHPPATPKKGKKGKETPPLVPWKGTSAGRVASSGGGNGYGPVGSAKSDRVAPTPGGEAAAASDSRAGRRRRTAIVLTAERQARFARFWAAYPRHDDRQGAQAAWAKLDPDEALTEQIVKAATARARNPKWQHEPQYIPNPATWLNHRRWEDEGVVRVAVSASRDLYDFDE